MCAIYMLLLFVFSLSSKVHCEQSVFGDDDLKEEPEDFSDWRDPTDMLNYNLVTGEMRNTEVAFV